MFETCNINNNEIGGTEKAPEILDHLTRSEEPPNVNLVCT